MVDFVGISSVADRTLFANKGPLVKRPLPLLIGSDARIASFSEVSIASGGFADSHVGKVLRLSGSPGGRNDGSFAIEEVLSPTRLRLSGASFSILDAASTTASCVSLANDLKRQYGLHRTRKVTVGGELAGVHGTDDGTNVVTADEAVDLATAITLANDLRTRVSAHVVNVSGDPNVHIEADSDNVVLAGAATNLAGLVTLLNELRRKYELHRQSQYVHQHVDLVDRISVQPVRPTVDVFPGPLTGPFSWTLVDPRYGQVADSPYDVEVTVNGAPAAVDAVFGLLGAIVLSERPEWDDEVSVDYDWLENPPSRFMRLNTAEFVLNQVGVTSVCGLPKHRYRASSHLLDPEEGTGGPSFSSPFQPFRRGWKYKALERAYTAVLNDPTSLLLNVPTNRIAYPVLSERVSEVTVRYDPFTLPQNAMDPWTLEGEGSLFISPGSSALTVVDQSTQTGVDSRPPFFSHAISLDTASVISCAIRARMSADEAVFFPDGVFGGVAFGLSDGRKASVLGLLLTEATGLSSAVVMANDAKAQLNGHLVSVGAHSPSDLADQVSIVDATGLPSLLVLVNALRTAYSSHAAKGGGPGLVHGVPDSVNVLSLPPADDLPSAVALVNAIRSALNAHGTQAGVHFVSDALHQVSLVRQAGILTSRGFPEFASSWEAFAVDWAGYVTYRLVREADGSASVFVSGSVEPASSVAFEDLPAASGIDARLDVLQQAFFGAIGRESKSSSDWQFVRVNVQPVNADLIENNKQVTYASDVVPELDPDAPWIAYGQGGTERILSPDVLLLDSTSSAAPFDVPELGLLTGAYRGFVRYEPILSVDNAMVVEFQAGADYWTQSVSDRALGVFLADGEFSVQIAFLQASPTPAVAIGTVADPFVLVNGDTLVLRVGDSPAVTVSFPIPPTQNTAASVAARINSVLGFAFASAVLGRVQLTSEDLGSSASFSVVSGSALAKLGLSPGVYFGTDSSPEPKMSWFGANLPELDDPQWTRGGAQPASLFNRVLRVVDSSTNDYAVWTLEDPLVTNQVLNPLTDWKVDVRLSVLSFVPGPTILASGPYQPLDFAGALVSVDEGPDGKNLELHLSVSSSGDQYLNLLTYDQSSGSLVVVSQYAFAWNDGDVHTLNVYTAKSINSIMVLADGVLLTPSAGPAPTYSGLQPGLSGPSFTFGSGGEPTSGTDLRVGRSVVDWHSVAAFRDSKIGDPSSADRRYVGVYKGGRPDVLSSYYLHQVDWAPLHTYRVLRDPSSGLQVYIDGGSTPVISVPYDVLALPPSSSSLLHEATRDRPFIAFGAFSPSELSRSRWEFIRYSVGKVTLTDLLVPPHQVLNQANVVSSPDHLRTKVPHKHQGFSVYSGGTPTDGFMSDPNVGAFTVLGEGTPPVPATQNLETRHGMVKVATPFESVPAVDAVNFRGFTSDLVDDTFNVAEVTAEPLAYCVAQTVVLANALRLAYQAHRVQAGVHFVNDVVNSVTAGAASDLATAVSLLNEIRSKFNLHLEQASVHVPDDEVNAVVAPVATDAPSAANLANAIALAFASHARVGNFHVSPDLVDEVTAPDATDLISASLLASTLADSFSAHALSTAFHEQSDVPNGAFASVLPGVGRAGVQGLLSLVTFDSLDVGSLVQFIDGPNAGQERVVVSKLTASEYRVAPGFLFDDPGTSRYVRMGIPTVIEALAVSGLGYSLITPSAPFTASLGDSVMFLGGPNFGEIRTVTLVAGADFRISPPLPVSDSVDWPMAYVRGASEPGVDPAYVVSLANALRARHGRHAVASGVHRTNDVVNEVTEPAAAVLADALPLLNDLKSEFNLHIDGSRFHALEDTVNVVTAPASVSPLSAAVATLNSVRSEYLEHIFQPRVHLQDDDVNALLPSAATDLTTGIVLANALKEVLNRHMVALVHEVVGSPVQRVHSEDDTVNTITSPDASDLATLCDLALDVGDRYNLHRVQPGVHGNTLLVRLEAPHRVLYEGMRFWNEDSGSLLAKVAPFSDDDTLTFSGPLKYGGDVSYGYSGDVLPENDVLRAVTVLANGLKADYNAHRTQAGVHLSPDGVNVVTAPNATSLASACALLADLRSKLDSHLLQAGVHVEEDTRDRIVAPDGLTLPMALALASELRQKYDAHRLSGDYHVSPDDVNVPVASYLPPVGDPGWVFTSSLPDAVNVTLLSSPENAVRIATQSPGCTAVYKRSLRIPDSRSLGFDLEVRLRINAYEYSPNVETGIYVGILSTTGNGVAAALGFDALSNIPYVKIQDLVAGEAVVRVPFNWADGQFHTYRITRDVRTDSLNLTVMS